MKLIHGLLAGLLLVLGISSQGAYAAAVDGLTYNPDGTITGFELPGITLPDFPNIYNDAFVNWSNGRRGGTLTARSGWGSDMFLTADLIDGLPDVYAIQRGSFRLSADFDKAGNFLGGSLIIRGRLQGPDYSGWGTLVTADLSAFAFNDGLIGFNTVNLQCWITGIQCTNGESVYLQLDQGGFSTDLRRYASTALAVTNLPLPAAVWLLGSGLLGLAGISRRRRSIAKQEITT